MINEEITTTVESKATNIRVVLEKLDGGYISNVTGRRQIHRDAEDIAESINLHKILNNIDNDEYHLNIDLVPKAEYQDFMDLIAAHKEEHLTLDKAKDTGIIECEKFNPHPAPVEPDLKAPITVTAGNAYSIDRLKAINWADMHDKVFLQPSEITKITGMNTTTLYASLPKARKGQFSFQNTSTRIGFTILAQYYEKTLGIRTSTKDQCEQMKTDVLECIREIELMGDKQKFLKSSEVMKKLNAIRNTLL